MLIGFVATFVWSTGLTHICLAVVTTWRFI
jgi:hypothetical protein